MEFKEVDALNNLKFRMETIIEDAYLRGYDAGYDKGHFAGINTRQKWAEQAKRGKEHRDEIGKILEEQNKHEECSIINDVCAYPDKECWNCPLNYQIELAKKRSMMINKK